MTILATTLATSAAADTDTRHTAVHVIESNQLRAEIMEPNDPARYNHGVRFTNIGEVLRVVMNGHDFLFSPVAHDPLKDNAGLASEFDIGATTTPPGFAEAAEGDGFVKIGVGVLRKKGPKYAFFNPYDVIDLAATQVNWAKSSAHFTQTCAGANGYAYNLTADVSVQENVLQIVYSLTNTGKKPLETEHYNHNFMSFDGVPVGPDYSAKFPFDFTQTGLQPEQQLNGREINFAAAIPPKVKAVNAQITPSPDYHGENSVTVTSPAAGMSVTASVTIPSTRVALHVTPRYLCPEQFVRINVAPGTTATWTRRYVFDGPPAKS